MHSLQTMRFERLPVSACVSRRENVWNCTSFLKLSRSANFNHQRRRSMMRSTLTTLLWEWVSRSSSEAWWSTQTIISSRRSDSFSAYLFNSRNSTIVSESISSIAIVTVRQSEFEHSQLNGEAESRSASVGKSQSSSSLSSLYSLLEQSKVSLRFIYLEASLKLIRFKEMMVNRNKYVSHIWQSHSWLLDLTSAF